MRNFVGACFFLSPTSDGHNSFKNRPNQAYEVFFDIYIKCRCQKTPHKHDLDNF